jgi:AcrR family transcriptional regulator
MIKKAARAAVYRVKPNVPERIYAVNTVERTHLDDVVKDDELVRPTRLQPVPARAVARRPLDQVLIVSEAVRFIDELGRDRLTMRQLGARLGVEAMALYRYVPGREQLLDAVVEMVMDELYRDTMVVEQAATWQEYLQQLAHGVRRLAIAHPQVFPLVATRPPAAPWLRPPLRSLRWVEGFLEGLAHYGFTAEACVLAYRAFATFLLGHLLLETGTLAMSTNKADDVEFIESSDLSDYPRLTALAPQLSRDEYSGEFDAALEDLLNRLDLARR